MCKGGEERINVEKTEERDEFVTCLYLKGTLTLEWTVMAVGISPFKLFSVQWALATCSSSSRGPIPGTSSFRCRIRGKWAQVSQGASGLRHYHLHASSFFFHHYYLRGW